MSMKLRLAGLAVIAVSALGSTSVCAQAAVHWNVQGKPLGSGATESLSSGWELTEVDIDGVKQKVAVNTISGLLRVSCTGVTMSLGKIIGTGGFSASNLRFTGCDILGLKGESLPKCAVKSKAPLDENGSIKTNSLTGSLKEVSGKAYVVLTPTTGTTFTEIEISGSGGSCALSTGGTKLTGSMAFRVPLNTEATKVEATSNSEVATAAGTSLKYGERPSTWDYDVDLLLLGGKVWGALSP